MLARAAFEYLRAWPEIQTVHLITDPTSSYDVVRRSIHGEFDGLRRGFPCVAISQVLARVGFAGYFVSLLVSFIVYVLFAVAIGVPSSKTLNAIAVILGIFYAAYMWYVRSRIRAMFQIPGSFLEDGCTVLFCGCCSLAQISTHVESYTPGHCAFDAKATLPGYNV
ncbi:hypothetical protein AeRB84_009418 [Aphanomyces euteiches]|nr:hypothetical protein AeRB84_009418 [Aphanomyces euteiches]